MRTGSQRPLSKHEFGPPESLPHHCLRMRVMIAHATDFAQPNGRFTVDLWKLQPLCHDEHWRSTPSYACAFHHVTCLPVCDFFLSVFLDFKGCNLSKCRLNRFNMDETKGEDQEEISYRSQIVIGLNLTPSRSEPS